MTLDRLIVQQRTDSSTFAPSRGSLDGCDHQGFQNLEKFLGVYNIKLFELLIMECFNLFGPTLLESVRVRGGRSVKEEKKVECPH